MAGDRLSVSPVDLAAVDAYLGELAGKLRGPQRRRRQILAELRDGLDQAIAERSAAGLAREQAVAAALEEFGTAQAIADAFAAGLATAYARRTIACYIATGPLVGIWWLLSLQAQPWRTGVVAFLTAIPVIPLVPIAIAVAAGTVATTGRLIRWLPETSPRRAVTATTVIAALAIVADLGLLTLSIPSTTLWQPMAILAVTASLTRIGCGLVTLRRAAALRRTTRAGR